MSKYISFLSATAITQAVVIGNIFAFGVLFPLMVKEVGSSLMEAAAAGSLQFGALFIGALVAVPMTERFGPRLPALVGALLWFGGMYGLSTSSNPYDPVLYIGLMCGIGGSLAYWSPLSQLSRWSGKKVQPMGWVLACAAFGQIAFVFAIPPRVSSAQWKTTIQTTAYTGFAFLLCAVALMFPPSPDSKQVPATTLRELVRDRDGTFFAVSSFFLMFGFYAPFLIVILDAQRIGASYLDATYLLGYMAAGSVIGRVSTVEIVKSWGVVNTHRLFILLTFLTTLGFMGSDTYALLVIFSSIYGFFASSIMSTIMLVCEDFWNRPSTITILLIPGATTSVSIACRIIEEYQGVSIQSKVFVSAMYFFALLFVIFVKRRPVEKPDLSNTELS